MKERARRCDDDEGEESRAAGGGKPSPRQGC